MATVLECVSGPPKGKRIEVVAGKPLPFKIRKHERDAGQVVIEIVGDQCFVTNRSELPCLVNGHPRPRSVLRNGDQLVIGKSTFVVHIADADAAATQQLDRLVLDDSAAQQICSVCDGVYVPQQGWSDGERRICRRCLVKGVRPDHLPRGNTPTATPVLNPDGETKVMGRDHDEPPPAPRAEPPKRQPPARPKVDSGAQRATTDSGVQRAAADDRHAKRISASRLSVVESENHPGILKKVSSMLGGGRADRNRLDQLEQERQRLLVEAGRLSLGSGGGLGLPDVALVGLLGGRKVTIDPDDLSWSVLDQWRSQRERILVLDTEIAALRKALGLGADHGAVLMPAPALRPEMKEQRERAFHTLDAIGTEDLGEAAGSDAPTTTATRPQPLPGKSNSSSGRRRPHRH